MKKIVIMGIVAGMALASQAGLVQWDTISLKGDAKLDSGAGVWTGGWTVELWQDVGADNTGGWQNTLPLGETVGNGAQNDIGLGIFSTTVLAPQVINQVASALVPNDIQIYTVLFNNAAKGSASRYLVYDDVTFNSGTVEAPGTPIPYQAGILTGPGSTGDAAGDWQVIPEPATFGLMGIAGLGMFLARKKTRR